MINRRRFLKAGLAAGLTVGAYSSGLVKASAAEKKADVFVIESKDTEKSIRALMNKLGGMSAFVKKGDTVLLKPNMAWSRAPEYAANTNPDVVAAVVKLCLEAGAGKVQVTDNSCNSMKSVYSISGIAEAAANAGAEVFYPRRQHYEKMRINGDFVDEWEVMKPVIEADVLINIPIAKQHGSSRITAGMKNWLGAVGGNRGFMHQDIHRCIADLAAFFKPDLTIIDCTRVLMQGGPTGGDLDDVRRLDMVMASLDPVALDAVTAKLLGAKPEDIDFLRYATKKGLGTMNLDEININQEKV
ncbi:DUF362 domain-containing protein [Limisalsivibrio acetivorans]|uniref:DUF362 domain-containing protein n=1 Tax=Limisalsivibrio acetivorans TaxID=1304888 RepID=UPI0003B2EAFF|nr:DUF362 domain-containing protein [Limisalsivibrio acetivorans]